MQAQARVLDGLTPNERARLTRVVETCLARQSDERRSERAFSASATTTQHVRWAEQRQGEAEGRGKRSGQGAFVRPASVLARTLTQSEHAKVARKPSTATARTVALRRQQEISEENERRQRLARQVQRRAAAVADIEYDEEDIIESDDDQQADGEADLLPNVVPLGAMRVDAVARSDAKVAQARLDRATGLKQRPKVARGHNDRSSAAVHVAYEFETTYDQMNGSMATSTARADGMTHQQVEQELERRRQRAQEVGEAQTMAEAAARESSSRRTFITNMLPNAVVHDPMTGGVDVDYSDMSNDRSGRRVSVMEEDGRAVADNVDPDMVVMMSDAIDNIQDVSEGDPTTTPLTGALAMTPIPQNHRETPLTQTWERATTSMNESVRRSTRRLARSLAPRRVTGEGVMHEEREDDECDGNEEHIYDEDDDMMMMMRDENGVGRGRRRALTIAQRATQLEPTNAALTLSPFASFLTMPLTSQPAPEIILMRAREQLDADARARARATAAARERDTFVGRKRSLTEMKERIYRDHATDVDDMGDSDDSGDGDEDDEGADIVAKRFGSSVLRRGVRDRRRAESERAEAARRGRAPEAWPDQASADASDERWASSIYNATSYIVSPQETVAADQECTLAWVDKSTRWREERELLRSPIEELGERPCSRGADCVIMQRASVLRTVFNPREYVSPTEELRFLTTGQWPAQPKPCVPCIRNAAARQCFNARKNLSAVPMGRIIVPFCNIPDTPGEYQLSDMIFSTHGQPVGLPGPVVRDALTLYRVRSGTYAERYPVQYLVQDLPTPRRENAAIFRRGSSSRSETSGATGSASSPDFPHIQPQPRATWKEYRAERLPVRC